MTLHVLATDPADQHVLARVVAARHRHAASPLTAEAFARWQQAQRRTAWGRAHISDVALMDGALRASAAQYDMRGLLDGRPVRVVAIGDLLSHGPSSDDARVLADRLVTHAAASGAAVVLLFSPVAPPWAAALGFSDITAPTLELTCRPTPRSGAPMVSIRAGDDGDAANLAGMGETAWSTSRRFHLRRDADFIKHGIIVDRLLAGLAPRGTQRLEFFATEEGTNAAAYVVLRVTDEGWVLQQCGDRDPSAARVGAIVQALVARDPSASPPRIQGWLPHGVVPPQLVATPAEASLGSVCVRVLDPGTPPLASEDALMWRSDCF